MLMKMTKEQFIESMQNAREEEKEYVNMADVAKIGDELKEAAERNENTPHTIRIGSEVKEAVEKGSGTKITGTKITGMVEPIHTDKPGKKRGRKPGRHQAKVPESWKERIKGSIELMAAEGAGKLGEAEALIGEAETLIHEAEELEEHIEALKEMIK